MHLVPAPAVRLMKRRVQSRPGTRQENRFPGLALGHFVFSSWSLIAGAEVVVGLILGLGDKHKEPSALGPGPGYARTTTVSCLSFHSSPKAHGQRLMKRK